MQNIGYIIPKKDKFRVFGWFLVLLCADDEKPRLVRGVLIRADRDPTPAASSAA
jgi:hypothetical protein